METTYDHTATYSPEDDKLRIYPAYRLPKEEYAQLKSAGFGWAPKQECFYAVWTPQREDVALDFCGEIGDEDKSLVERAEERADRFENYSDKRAHDADQAHKAVKSIADCIPFGQPILVGHHSERRARKDAERIENGMRKAVKMWETSEYWTRRAAGALANAKYKELPAVRARRIKTIEADKRKREREMAELETTLKFWKQETITKEHALAFCNYHDRGGCILTNGEQYWSAWSALERDDVTVEALAEQKKERIPRYINHAMRWINHFDCRLAYEKAMLDEQGGLTGSKYEFEVGGKVQHKWGWNLIKKINKKGGIVCSLSLVSNQYPQVIQIEDVRGYEAPSAEESQKVKAATKLPPMCNYITPECATMTQAEFTAQYKDHKGSRIVPATDEHGAHRVRRIQSFLGRKYGCDSKDQWGSVDVFISDAKVTPPPTTKTAKVELPQVPRQTREVRTCQPHIDDTPEHITAMKASLKAGVQTVSAPQLFPTPPELAAKMVNLVGPVAGCRILEPSAGTANLIKAAVGNATGWDCCKIVAVEKNHNLVEGLKQLRSSSLYCNESNFEIKLADFLECGDEMGTFHIIIMNPPFENGSDIKHILHAKSMLKPGGKLVAICAGGPRQAEKLQPLCDTWEPLPAGTFVNAGTNVNTVLLTMSN